MNRKDTEYLKEWISKENMRTPNQTTSSIHVFYRVISETDSFTFSCVSLRHIYHKYYSLQACHIYDGIQSIWKTEPWKEYIDVSWRK